MKKLLRNIGILVAVIGIVTIIGSRFFGWFDKTDDYILNKIKKLESYDANIMIYGDEIPKSDIKLAYKRLSALTEESIKSDKSNQYQLIIINDLSGNTTVTDDELKLIKRYCEEKHYDFIYFGTSKNEQFIRCGFGLYEEMPFMYQGYQFVDKKAPEFNGTDWYDSATDTYYANPYWLGFEWDGRSTAEYNYDSSIFFRQVVLLALYSIEG